MATYQVRYDENGQKILSDPLTGLSSTIATSETTGAVKPDNVTTKVDSSGIMSVMGGNLLMNDEIRITESGTFTAPVTGWYHVWLKGGGAGGGVLRNSVGAVAQSGSEGASRDFLYYMEAGEEVPVVVGAGGIGEIISSGGFSNGLAGGATIFGTIGVKHIVDIGAPYDPEETANELFKYFPMVSIKTIAYMTGAGRGGGYSAPGMDGVVGSGRYYGAGAAASIGPTAADDFVGNGGPGIIILRFWNPAKASGSAE